MHIDTAQLLNIEENRLLEMELTMLQVLNFDLYVSIAEYSAVTQKANMISIKKKQEKIAQKQQI